ncbi:MAG: DinB family protein [PVC group bacterium]|nr:DinB family protein [PVC group bacterium]
MMTTISLLRKQLNFSFDLVTRAMADIDDTMLHWEPAPNSWGLRLHNDLWIIDSPKPDPIPPGPKTIGWLAAHLAGCKEMYFDYAFGPGNKIPEQLILPGDAIGLNKYLVKTQKALKQKLSKLSVDDLEKKTATFWGEKKPIWWIYWIMIYHDTEHGGQIMQIKNEYKNKP